MSRFPPPVEPGDVLDHVRRVRQALAALESLDPMLEGDLAVFGAALSSEVRTARIAVDNAQKALLELARTLEESPAYGTVVARAEKV